MAHIVYLAEIWAVTWWSTLEELLKAHITLWQGVRYKYCLAINGNKSKRSGTLSVKAWNVKMCAREKTAPKLRWHKFSVCLNQILVWTRLVAGRLCHTGCNKSEHKSQFQNFVLNISKHTVCSGQTKLTTDSWACYLPAAEQTPRSRQFSLLM